MTTTPEAQGTRAGVELTGLETIPESERKGRPAGLFWPWFAANVSVFGIAYGAYLLGFGLSFWQATVVGVLGVVFSFFLVGVVSLAGKRGSAPTMVLSRTMFGVHGARVVSVLSWILTVGWETVLCVSAVYAVDAASDALFGGDATKNPGLQIVTLLIVAAIIVALGVFGFTWIMRAQLIITIVTGVATVIFLITVIPHIDLGAVGALPAGPTAAVIGGLVFMMTGFGLGWVNAGADYSRYLPRRSSGAGVVAWTTIGAALPVVVLFLFGVLLAGSSKKLSDAIGAYSLGPLVGLTPAWFIVPFAIIVVLGLIAGAVMDIYSSGLALLSAGLRIPRPAAAGVDGVIMTLLSIYVIFFGGDFLGQFQGFLITLGVPIAAWCGIFIADVILRRRDLDEAALYSARGRYRAVNWLSIALLVVGTAVGWGLVTNSYAGWLGWQGYLLFGARADWGGANLGVLVALVIGFVGYLIGGRGTVRRQEA